MRDKSLSELLADRRDLSMLTEDDVALALAIRQEGGAAYLADLDYCAREMRRLRESLSESIESSSRDVSSVDDVVDYVSDLLARSMPDSFSRVAKRLPSLDGEALEPGSTIATDSGPRVVMSVAVSSDGRATAELSDGSELEFDVDGGLTGWSPAPKVSVTASIGQDDNVKTVVSGKATAYEAAYLAAIVSKKLIEPFDTLSPDSGD